MKILVFFGSPNVNGNTGSLLNSFLKGVEGENQMEIIEVYNKKILPCRDCKYCYDHKECAIKDDMSELYNKITESDIVVMATPLYFSAMPAPLKAVIDRLQIFWSKKYIREDRKIIKSKKGIILATAGANYKDMFKPLDVILKYAFAAMDILEIEKVYARDTDKVQVKDNSEILEEAYKLGKKLKK